MSDSYAISLLFCRSIRGGINQFSSRFTTMAIVKLLDRKLANLTSMQWTAALFCVSYYDGMYQQNIEGSLEGMKK